jgi:hypothetical protein
MELHVGGRQACGACVRGTDAAVSRAQLHTAAVAKVGGFGRGLRRWRITRVLTRAEGGPGSRGSASRGYQRRDGGTVAGCLLGVEMATPCLTCARAQGMLTCG